MAEKDDERGIAAKLRPLTLKAKFGIGVGCVLLVAGCCGVAVAMQPQPEAEQPAAQEQAAETQKQRATIKVELGERDAAAATALVAHITGNGVDLYTALDEKGQAQVDLALGDYEVEFVPSIGADGSLLKVAGKQKLQIKDSGAAIGKPPIRRESKSREAGKIRPVMVGRESAAC